MSQNVAITDSYLNSVFKLNAQEKKITINTIRQLAKNPTSSSLHVHAIDKIKCDKHFLSARVNLDIRVIFVKRNDIYTLLYVDHHDDAYDWCEGKYLIKTDFGAEYIYDEKLVENKLGLIKEEPMVPNYLNYAQNVPLYEKTGIKKKQIERLGIQEVHADNLLQISDEKLLLEYIEIFPEELQEALIDLATNTKPYDQVYNELFFTESETGQKRNSNRRFYITQDMDELQKLTENDEFEKWTIFLHPSQEKLVKADFQGPTLIEGGPGTGKTIVGIHRAAYLSANIYPASEGKRILLCTFSKKLANSISGKLSRLFELKNITNNVDVMNVDKYISDMLGSNYLSVDSNGVKMIIREIYFSKEWNYSLEFFECEYYEIIERFNIQSEDEYLSADRKGMGTALSRSERKMLWTFFSSVLEKKRKEKIYNFVDRAVLLKQKIESGEIAKEYDSIIIDEAQDLESQKLSCICGTVKNQKNGIFILSDRNQRIFRLNTWSQETGVNIVGRTYYLRINYRTTKQINEYARHQFGFFDLSKKENKEYISVMSGDEPEVIDATSDADENRIIVERAKKLISAYKPNEICILAPSYEKLKVIQSILEYEKIKVHLLTGNTIPVAGSGVNLCHTSGVKGLEFSVVIIADFNNIGTEKKKYDNSFDIGLKYNKLVECEKYVAITRARDHVIITYVEED